VNGFNEAFALVHAYRVAHHGEEAAPPNGLKLEAKLVDVKEGRLTQILEEDGVSISAFNVDHDPVKPAYGYRIEYGGRSVVISGDTTHSEYLVKAAKGADLLVHETLAPKLVSTIEATSARHGRNGLALVMSHIPDYHASPADAFRAANEANVSALALTHLIPGLPSRYFDKLFTDGAEEAFDGPYWLMNDGDVVSMPVGGGIRQFHAD
jgi:ribonuclease Z